MDATKNPGIKINQIFLSRCHFETRNDALALPPTTPVEDIPTKVKVRVGISPDEKSGIVSVSVFTPKEEAANSLYRFGIEFVAVVEQTDEPNMSLRDYVVKAGPAALYPFVRETLASLSGKGRFGPLWLPPMNLLALTTELEQREWKPQEASLATE
ncbi:MAG: protein-export chaperone SecB [Gemmatimonadaceae bacterium]